MNKQTFIPYMKTTLSEFNKDFNWQVSFKSNLNIYEITFDMALPQVTLSYKLKDNDSNFSTGTPQVLRDRICFYDESVSYFDSSDYLLAIAVDFEKGIEAGFIEVLLKQLNILANTGENQLIEFMQVDTTSHFELEWPKDSFEETLDTYKATGRYDNEIIPFVRNEGNHE